jgi:hypothetical protein
VPSERTFVSRHEAVGKTLVVDFDNRSVALNDESTLIAFELGDWCTIIRLLVEDLQHATEFAAPEFRRRSWRDRLTERAANLLTRML